ncbi:endolytic transglycosylase MltG [Bacteroidales bacterium OttesenSCG-928-K03]|nr:endolytic transglycosylase MltG [Odoribacter sp. OttesenSCG-928-L07]MDL2239396.1 endolytic transglycosylase MltG [Bacteroidales bacterium OttesenSCG-928-L14]MDL2240744.1 endolytic transglycosylase MltG [Bacteroidales bacterium OttesenSCG-928-K22]MDL2242739.1 endolytic transglycosylase MltG [Bacteroidales bacterium OttesenSCG-928-K03]
MTKKDKKSIFGIILIVLITLILLGYHVVNQYFYSPNVDLRGKTEYSLYISDSTDFDEILAILISDTVLVNPKKFVKHSERENYINNIKPGRYLVKDGMTDRELIHILKLGEQTPVRVVFNSTRNIYSLASKVSTQIEADSASIVDTYFDPDFLATINMSPDNAYLMIIPNTYEFYWNTDAQAFWKRMKRESDNFWNEKRKHLADSINFTLEEVVILASIVERETNVNDEKATIAGVYVNRLNNRQKLQADPTLVYLLEDQNIRRVLNKHKNIDSPYNTYKYAGLPPGPIWIPSISSIDAVLNYEDHDYIFFCASHEFSGRHNFAKTYSQHQENARKFQKALDERDIYK